MEALHAAGYALNEPSETAASHFIHGGAAFKRCHKIIRYGNNTTEKGTRAWKGDEGARAKEQSKKDTYQTRC